MLRLNLQGYDGVQSSQLRAVPAGINSACVPHVCDGAIMARWHKTRCTNGKADWHLPMGASLAVILIIEAKPAACCLCSR